MSVTTWSHHAQGTWQQVERARVGKLVFRFPFGCIKHKLDTNSNEVILSVSGLDSDLTTDLAESDLYSG